MATAPNLRPGNKAWTTAVRSRTTVLGKTFAANTGMGMGRKRAIAAIEPFVMGTAEASAQLRDLNFIPRNTVLPVVTGTTTVGSTLTTTDGTWVGTPAPTYTRIWRRNGTPIAGATALTYVLVAGDLGALISCRVTATNSEGSTNAFSASVGPIT